VLRNQVVGIKNLLSGQGWPNSCFIQKKNIFIFDGQPNMLIAPLTVHLTHPNVLLPTTHLTFYIWGQKLIIRIPFAQRPHFKPLADLEVNCFGIGKRWYFERIAFPWKSPPHHI